MHLSGPWLILQGTCSLAATITHVLPGCVQSPPPSLLPEVVAAGGEQQV